MLALPFLERLKRAGHAVESIGYVLCTCSRPTDDMREAMARASVGDDIYGDDPTVKTLEREVADMLGTEDTVFMPTGTMTNQVAIQTHTEPGDAVFFDQSAHAYLLEGGAPAACSGVFQHLLPDIRGVFGVADLNAEQVK